jgi:hypothetical protein
VHKQLLFKLFVNLIFLVSRNSFNSLLLRMLFQLRDPHLLWLSLEHLPSTLLRLLLLLTQLKFLLFPFHIRFFVFHYLQRFLFLLQFFPILLILALTRFFVFHFLRLSLSLWPYLLILSFLILTRFFVFLLRFTFLFPPLLSHVKFFAFHFLLQ